MKLESQSLSGNAEERAEIAVPFIDAQSNHDAQALTRRGRSINGAN